MFMTTASYWEMMREAIRNLPFLFTVFSLFVGCCIGSFLNVCIYRIPNGMSLLYPPSHCPNCDHKITWYENIPLFSFLALRGKCSGCGKPISPRYFYVELLTGVLYCIIFMVLVYLRNGCFHLLPLYFIAAAAAVVLAFTDCEYRILPDSVVVFLLTAGLANAAWKGWLFASGGYRCEYILVSAASAAAVGGGLWLFRILAAAVLKKEGFGMGDVKYMTAIAACFCDIPAILILMCSCVLAIVCVCIYRIFDRRRVGRVFPFGPFISA